MQICSKFVFSWLAGPAILHHTHFFFNTFFALQDLASQSNNYKCNSISSTWFYEHIVLDSFFQDFIRLFT